MMTESPRRNILLMNRSLLTARADFLPLPDLPCSVHISWTCSRTILQWRSKAFTRPSSLWLLRRLISTCVLLTIEWWRTDSGPVLKSSSLSWLSSSGRLDMIAATLATDCPRTFHTWRGCELHGRQQSVFEKQKDHPQ